MSIRFGVSPIAWINDDMPELGGDTPLETVLADARDLGFAGIELGGKFPRDPAVLKSLLDRYELQLVGGWYSSNLLVRTAAEEIEALEPHLSLLKAMGSEVFIIAETSNAVHGNRSWPLGATPRLSDEAWPAFGRRLTEVASYIEQQGLRLAYHYHLGTSVERPEDIENFLCFTGPEVGFTVDTGHARLGGIDPVALIRNVPARIAHVHCKDVRGETHRNILARDASFLDGVLSGMFTVPGDGDMEFAPVMEALKEIDYSGWIIIEAEQDPAVANPREYGAIGLETLKREASSAGLMEALP